ncbi:TMEM165/GDT1 family protein [Synechococcus sp. CBW1002]|uniref:TMEM165/GDT1 family protein n=1 Tax=Synechococcus sp. CBW1002 TaxID=1353134 RepID=UPI0018CDE641|nr:TMEM165/GDT1 family protein [Synechococcus sp. CBW1002]QPN59650.1 TMEM165/GDT1 family protein [Synechococcus sp. CBW1002]
MPLALLASTFATVFLAELGDKTQLAIVTISGTSSRPTAVFAGSSVALVLASLLGAAAGGSLSSVVPTDLLQLVASLGFLVIGLRLIQRSRVSEDDLAGGEALAGDDLVRVDGVVSSAQEPPA